MNPLPLLSREFRVAARRPLTFRLRAGFGAGGMLLAVWALLVATGAGGYAIFVLLATAASFLCVITGMAVASDSISRERREGTLGFLFLSGLRARDIVAGKLGAAGIVPVYTLLALFPAFALCQLIGGVSAGLFWRMMAALAVELWFALSASLWVSSLCEDYRKAYAGTALLLMVVNPLWLNWSTLYLSPLHYLCTMVLFGLLGIFFLAMASRQLDRNWRREISVKDARLPQIQRAVSRKLLESFPVAWMMLRRRPAEKALLVALALVVALANFIPQLSGAAMPRLAFLFLIHLACYFVILGRSAYVFYADRQNGSLELLLASRLSGEEIFAGFVSFLMRQSAPVAALLTVADLSHAALFLSQGAIGAAALCVALAAILWTSICGFGWVGVYRALRMDHPSLAMISTFARTALAPLGLSLLFLGAPGTDHRQVAVFAVTSSVFLTFFFAADAKHALQVHGRNLLLRPVGEKGPEIESTWSFIQWDESSQPESAGKLLGETRTTRAHPL